MRRRFKNMDKFLFFLMVLYTILGLVMLFSASSITAVLQYNYSEYHFFIRQLIFFVIAYFIGFIILFLKDSFINIIKRMPKILLLIALGLLVYTAIFGIEIKGAKSWISLGVVSIQPSEFVKTLVILGTAFSFTHLKKMSSGYKFLIPFTLDILLIGLIAFQPDFGTAVIVAIICFLLFISIPIKTKNYVKFKILACICAVIGIGLFVFGGNILKKIPFFTQEQVSRFTYANPCKRYSESTGYQVCNGFIAINNGGLFGVGLGNSTQKYLYLPEAYTDFIFPIISEELGSIVASLIIIGFIIILYRILRIARNADTLSGSMIAYGVFGLILAHLLINLLGVLAIIPLTGVPLPFLSNGGSFNFNLIILLFIVERVQIDSNDSKLRRAINNL